MELCYIISRKYMTQVLTKYIFPANLTVCGNRLGAYDCSFSDGRYLVLENRETNILIYEFPGRSNEF